MRAARTIAVAVAALGVAALAAAPVSARPTTPHDNVYLAQIRYQAQEGMDVNGEYVKLTNGHDYYVDLNEWTLTAQGAERVYTFPDKWLAPGESVWLYSGRGLDAGANLHWRSHAYLWNNTRDTATLRNGRGTLIDSCAWRTTGAGYTNC